MTKFTVPTRGVVSENNQAIFDNLLLSKNMYCSVPYYDGDKLCGRLWIQVRPFEDRTIVSTQYGSKRGVFEGEGIDLWFDPSDEVHKFIEANYEITED